MGTFDVEMSNTQIYRFTLEVYGDGRRIGKSTQVWDAVMTDEATGRTIALFRCTQMILWPKA